jgi:hypothetical protein
MHLISDQAIPPTENILSACIDPATGLWGFKDNAGHFVIDPRFDDAGEFSEGLASVQILNKWGFIDQWGEVVIKPRYLFRSSFHSGNLMDTNIRRIWNTVSSFYLDAGELPFSSH